MKKDIASALGDYAGVDLAKGTNIIEKLGALSPEATAKDASGLHEETKAVAASLKSRDAQLASDIETLRQRFAALKNTIKMAAGQNPPDYVNTMRGSADSDYISKGNTFPATAMPFGFNMWSPVNTYDDSTFYEATEGNDMRGFFVTHEASKWNGNYQAMMITPTTDVSNSGNQPFHRKNEIAKAHYYSVTYDNGMKTEITPTDHAAHFRITAPDKEQKTGITFNTYNGSLVVNQDQGTASGVTNHGSDSWTRRCISSSNSITR